MNAKLSPWFRVCVSVSLALCLPWLGACAPQSEAPAESDETEQAAPTDQPSDESQAGAALDAVQEGLTQAVDETTETVEQIDAVIEGVVEQAEEAIVEAEPAEAVEDVVATATEPLQLTLGAPELTAGIPGEGELTIEQIETWLANAENHRVIDPVLPFGLSAAQGNVQGLDANPLTKAKIELGRQLYFDGRLSSDGTISCASCHHPDQGYGAHTQFGVGVGGQTGNRNSPVSYNRILSGPQFWDGRAASLEEQAGGPIANPIEMGNTHEKALETIANIDGYRMQFEAIFPDQGVTLDTVTKAIASFERAIVTGPTPYDYLEIVRTVESSFGEDLEELEEEDPELFAQYQTALSNIEGLSESARRGRDLFFSDRVGCTACHAGANFTDEKYHNLGVGMDVEDPDLGRFAITGTEQDKGAFKTPTVRNVALSPPYMHDGSQQTLEEVVEWYDKGGHPNPHLSDKVKKLDLTDQEEKDLVAFMKDALTGSFPEVEQGRLPQ